MSRIPSETLDQISSKIDPLDVFGRYVQLKTRGRKATGLCPFHSERTPSFSVDLERGLWYCFGCSEGGSVFNFLMRMEGLNFPQTVKKLADEVGVHLELSEVTDPEALQRDRLRELLERTAQYYSEMLWRSPLGEPARAYLESRGLSKEIAEKFRLGWAPSSGQALKDKLLQAGYTLEEGIAAGVVRERSGRDLMRQRLIFPITNVTGKVVAFGGRTVEENLDRAIPKYLNTPETEIYSKREHLYGLSFHRGEITRAKEALVMEGYLDVIAVSQAGFPIAVASLGTALTEEQCRLLGRYTRRVHLFYDADRAGRSATEKAIELFERANLLVNVSDLQTGEDPDSIIRERGVEAFRKIKESTVEVVDYLIDRKSEEFDLTTRDGREGFNKAVLPAISKVQDVPSRDRYMRHVASLLQVGETALGEQIRSLSRGRDRGVATAPVRRSRTGLHAEERLLSLMLKRPEWNELVDQALEPDDLTRPELRPLLEVLLRFRSIERPLTWTDLNLQDEMDETVWARLMAAEVPESSQADMERLISDIKRNGLKPRYDLIRQQVLEVMSKGPVDPDSELYKEYRYLQKRLKGTRNE